MPKTQKKKRTSHEKILLLTTMAVFSALAYVCQFVFHIKVAFLTFDAKDALFAVGAMQLGPLSAVVMPVVVSLLELVTISDTGWYGFIMNVLSSVSFTLVASCVYHARRRLSTAVAALSLAALSMTAVMMAANLLITPVFLQTDRTAVAEMIPTLLLPFNLTKGIFNASLTLLLYKPMTRAMRSARMIPGSGASASKKSALTVALLSLLIACACLATFIFILKGSFS